MPRLNDDELDRLLRRSPIVHIATTGADGAPFVVPVAYLYRDGEILLTAREKVSWLANIRRDPRVCLSVDQIRYPLAKVTIRGEAEIRYEPGQDDRWREVRLPIADDDAAPIRVLDDGSEEWLYDHAYHTVTHDEPRALVVIALARSKVTSWRMPLVGEYVDESWPASYYRNRPRRFRVTEVGPTLRDVKVISEPEREDI